MTFLVRVLLFTTGGSGCFAATQVGVQQLADLISSSRSDKEIARKIAGIQLTQRLTGETLSALLRQRNGSNVRDELQKLADESALLDPPASEWPNQPPPSLAEQSALLEKVQTYASAHLEKLPNFLCTLVIRRFDDEHGRGTLRLRDTVVSNLTLIGGKESTAIQTVNGVRYSGQSMKASLTTQGEFGGLLASLFVADSKPQFVWSHWEIVSGQNVAVFHYSMGKAHSNYKVTYWRPASMSPAPIPITITTASAGELSIEPTSGAVLRVTEQAVDIPGAFPVRKAGLVVEYGAVLVGGESFLCPIRSVSSLEAIPNAPAYSMNPTVRSLNAVQFTNYHKFQADSSLLAVDIPRSENPPAPPPLSNQPPPPTELAEPSAAKEVNRPEPLAKPEEPAAAIVPAPAEAAATPAPTLPETILKVRRTLVTVPVVVRDRQGHSIGGLQRENFELFDGSERQAISGFSVESREANNSQGVARSERQVNDHAGGTSNNADQPVSLLPDQYVAYMFDDLHLTAGDLIQARRALERLLRDPLDPKTRVAVITTSGQVTLDFTNDLLKLDQALQRLKLARQSQAPLGVCPPEYSYYLADRIINQHDREALRLAMMQEGDCSSRYPEPDARSHAQESLNQHQDQSQAALGALKAAIRRFAMLQGRRSIVLISPGFVSTVLAPEINDTLAHAARNGVVINTVDARGLYVPAMTDIQKPPSAAAGNPEFLKLKEDYDRREQVTLSDILGQLAVETGGTFFQNDNNLYAGLKQLTAAPEETYVLTFTPQHLEENGAYHKLRVRLVDLKDQHGLVVQARHGYFAKAPSAKDEIESALFSRESLLDMALAVKAETAKTEAGGTKVVIVAHLDLKPVRFQSQGGHSRSSLTATFALFDTDGKYRHGQQDKINLDYPSDTLAARVTSGLNVKSEFEATAGDYIIRVVLRDEAGQVSAITKMIQVP